MSVRVLPDTKVLPAIARLAQRLCESHNRWAADRMLERAELDRADGNEAHARVMEMKARWYLGEEA